MLTRIVAKLKTGSVTNVVPYGGSDRPDPSTGYVVVKDERDPIGRGRVIRVITHFPPDHQKWLEDYVREELPGLLSGFQAETRLGNTLEVSADDQEMGEIFANNDDGTISMERTFLVPQRLHT